MATMRLDFRTCEADIREELESVLSSPQFSSSRRSKEFLRYVVEETLAGRSALIKERSIAMAVFERGSEYEPGADSIVRVKAVEVRKRLAQHYAASPASRLRIEMPQGGYVPEFETVETPAAAEPLPLPDLHVTPLPGAKPSSRLRWLPLGAVAIAVIGILGWTALRTRPDMALDGLWHPMVSQRAPVLIGLPSPVLYTLPGPPAGPIPPEDVVKSTNYFVGTGAAYGAAQVAAMLTSRDARFVVKVGPEVSYEDLKNQPAVFLGAHSSAWTMEFAGKLRYQFVHTPAEEGVFDSTDRARRWVRPATRHEEDVKEDFALVARISDRNTGNPVLLVAGCGARGTHAAAEFVSNESAFEQFAAAAPKDWKSRNFEVVLQAEIHGAVPGKPKVVAWYVW